MSRILIVNPDRSFYDSMLMRFREKYIAAATVLSRYRTCETLTVVFRVHDPDWIPSFYEASVVV